MVPDGDSKTVLRTRYEQFLEQSSKEEITHGDIEKVAANILNLTTQDTIITAGLALSAFNIGLDTVSTIAITPMLPPPKRRMTLRPPVPAKKEPDGKIEFTELRREKLAEQLMKLHELSIHLKEIGNQKEVQEQLVFLADSGLKVALSMDLPALIPETALKELNEKLHMLELGEMVEWRKDMRAIRKSRIEMMLNMDHFDEFMHPARILVGRGAFRNMHPFQIDSLATANPDSFKTLLKIHSVQMGTKEQHRGTDDMNN